jgi:hypothetical protein
MRHIPLQTYRDGNEALFGPTSNQPNTTNLKNAHHENRKKRQQNLCSGYVCLHLNSPPTVIQSRYCSLLRDGYACCPDPINPPARAFPRHWPSPPQRGWFFSYLTPRPMISLCSGAFRILLPYSAQRCPACSRPASAATPASPAPDSATRPRSVPPTKLLLCVCCAR